jgi:hypothetical protein
VAGRRLAKRSSSLRNPGARAPGASPGAGCPTWAAHGAEEDGIAPLAEGEGGRGSGSPVASMAARLREPSRTRRRRRWPGPPLRAPCGPRASPPARYRRLPARRSCGRHQRASGRSGESPWCCLSRENACQIPFSRTWACSTRRRVHRAGWGH